MNKAVLASALLITACAAPQKSPPAGGAADESSQELLSEGYELLADGYRKRAIETFDKLIAKCDSQYGAEDKTVYASRGMTETIYYMTTAAAAKEDAITTDTTCSDALYLRGYASLDSGELELAEKYLGRAVAMAPVNAMYLSELGHINHVKRDWQRALDLFRAAEEYAQTYTPPELKDKELARAKRGVGYSLIELGKLDEAEAKFRECLEIDSNDKMALHELEYIEQVRRNKPE